MLTFGGRNGVMIFGFHMVQNDRQVSLQVFLHSDRDSSHYLCLVIEIRQTILVTVNIYGYNSKQENCVLEIKFYIGYLNFPNPYS